ncbi:Arc family DNA-binding protein [Pseudomonas sp. NY15356]|uniref:Arc family DNA-binding protein n=1 Tax=unclassified Pseudomonas TaxID=196821 RepID=UPI003A8ABC0F
MAFEYDSRTADKFVVRLPDGMRDQVAAAASADDRSMNSLIITAIRNELEGRARANALIDALTNAAEAKGVTHDAA